MPARRILLVALAATACSRELDVPPLVPDTLSPLVEPARLRIVRNALGANDQVAGSAGAVTDRSGPVVVRIWAAPSGGTPLLEAPVDADGALGPVDVPGTATLAPARLWLSAADARGNASDRVEIENGAGAAGAAVFGSRVRIVRNAYGIQDAVAGDAGALGGGCAPTLVEVLASPEGAPIASGPARADRGFDEIPVGTGSASFPTLWIAAEDKCGLSGAPGRAGVGEDLEPPAIDGVAATYELNFSGNEYDPDPEWVQGAPATVTDAYAIRELRVLGPDASTVLATLRPQGDGSFPRQNLAHLDAPRIYLAATDKAGNDTGPVLVRTVIEAQTAYRRLRSRPEAAPLAAHSLQITFDPAVATTAAAFPGLMTGLRGEMEDTVLGYPGLWTPYNYDSYTYASPQPADGPGWTLALNGSYAPARMGAAVAYASTSGEVILFGGSASNSGVCGPAQEYCGDTRIYDLTAGTVTALPADDRAPAPRAHHQMVFDAVRGKVVLFGGNNAASAFPVSQDCDDTAFTADCGGTWEFDPALRTWSWVVPADTTGLTAPIPRMLHSMAYDPLRGRVVLFGGASQGYCRGRTGGSSGSGRCGDTWEYDGNTWSFVAPAAAPSPRYGAAMAWHSGLRKVVLFGGYGESGCDGSANAFCAGTWTWDGSSWTTVTPAASPSPRSRGAMALDPARNVLILVGGYGNSGCDGPVDAAKPTCCGKTWEFDGTTWIDRGAPPSTDLATRLSPVAFDTGRRRLFRFAGNYCDNVVHTFSSEVWEYARTSTSNRLAAQAYVAAMPAGADLVQMRIRHAGVGQGDVNAAGAGALGYLLRLHAWDFTLRQWRPVGSHTQSGWPTPVIERTFTGAEATSLVGPGGRVWLLATAPPTRSSPAITSLLTANHALVELTYRLW